MEKIGFIGAGAMAEALIKGIISAEASVPENILISDTNPERLSFMTGEYGIGSARDNAALGAACDTVFIAVKPGQVARVVAEVTGSLSDDTVVISIAAGVTTASINGAAGRGLALVRVMPNTPALVQEGVFGLYFTPAIDPSLRAEIEGLFTKLGLAVTLDDEELLDAVTGLSGSGPAFVAMFIEALAEGGVKMGLPSELAMRMAAQTVLGSARICASGLLHPTELKDMVSSPGGTTIEGIRTLEERAFRGTVMSAVESATLRSRELSKLSEDKLDDTGR